MTGRRSGLLAEIEAGAHDERVSLSSLLQKCIVLGGRARSQEMRDWARQELNGFDGSPDSLPGYRRIPAPMIVQITNRAGYNGITQRIYNANLPDAFNDMYDVDEAALTNGIGELVAMAGSGKAEHHLSPGWSSLLVELLNAHYVDRDSLIVGAYWSVSNVAIQGLLVRVRTSLAELVAELSRRRQGTRRCPTRTRWTPRCSSSSPASARSSTTATSGPPKAVRTP